MKLNLKSGALLLLAALSFVNFSQKAYSDINYAKCTYFGSNTYKSKIELSLFNLLSFFIFSNDPQTILNTFFGEPFQYMDMVLTLDIKGDLPFITKDFKVNSLTIDIIGQGYWPSFESNFQDITEYKIF